MGQPAVVVDAAGGSGGGAGRLKAELDVFLAGRSGVTVIGRQRYLTPSWLVLRELHPYRAPTVLALNNVSFFGRGGQRRVLVHNALHFLRPSEEHMLAVLPRSFRAQIPVVRRSLRRADFIAVPCRDMAERVRALMPGVADRLEVLANPVTSIGPRTPDDEPAILVPVVPSPYKNVVAELRSLLAALDLRRRPARVWVTAHRHQLPADLSGHPRLVPLGQMPHDELVGYWRRCHGVFFPCTLESFGYPLAEARVYGLPVFAPESAQAREVAGAALVPYRLADVESLAEALDRLDDPVTPEPDAFAREPYFRRLLGLAAGGPAVSPAVEYGSGRTGTRASVTSPHQT